MMILKVTGVSVKRENWSAQGASPVAIEETKIT